MNNRWRTLKIQNKIQYKRENLKFIKRLKEAHTNAYTNVFSPIVSLESPMTQRRLFVSNSLSIKEVSYNE